MPGSPARELCAVGARRVGEPLFGTASRVDVWLVLEVPGAWKPEVEEALPAAVERALRPLKDAVPRSRVLFVKGHGRSRADRLHFYVGVTDELEPRLHHFELESYDALEGLDLFGVLAEEEPRSSRDAEPLYLVCTHGNHDRCCAKFGFPVYRSLAGLLPERVWQSSHVGGDRFAANVVCLPGGVYYGHVTPEEGEALLRATQSGRLLGERWRGRACYAAPVQAAEYYLREAAGEWSLSAYRLCRHRQAGEEHEAAFLDRAAGELHTVRVGPAVLDGLRAMTCGVADPKPVRAFRLLDHRVTPFQPDRVRIEGVEFRREAAAMRDYGFIYRLRRETLRPHLDALAMPDGEQVRFCASFDASRHRVVWRGESRAGAISVLERPGALHLANLHLLPGHQRQGLGTALLRDLQNRAAARELAVTTQVLKRNPALRFYERLGFRIIGEQGLRYRLRWDP